MNYSKVTLHKTKCVTFTLKLELHRINNFKKEDNSKKLHTLFVKYNLTKKLQYLKFYLFLNSCTFFVKQSSSVKQ